MDTGVGNRIQNPQQISSCVATTEDSGILKVKSQSQELLPDQSETECMSFSICFLWAVSCLCAASAPMMPHVSDTEHLAIL